ncbi:MAG: dicarboxylate/amino acid:cation symporter [Clostridia bacterium]|nr:dicarboxylate/amino acid:cation symporter [Clostridia bacterium]
MRRTLPAFSKEYKLNGEGIDLISETLSNALEQFGMEKRNRIRIRLSFEESLLRLRDKFGKDATVVLSMGNSLGRPFIQLSLEGDVFNPLSKREVDLEDWSGALLTAVGLYPQYSYTRGRNILRLNLPMRRINPAFKILIALAVGIVLGMLITTCCSDTQQAALTEVVLQPIYDLWIRILSVLSGPVIFFMVLTTVLNTGSIEEEGGSSAKVAIRYFVFSAVSGLIAIIVCGLFKGSDLVIGQTLGVDASKYLDHILHVVPEDILTPILDTNTPQILLFAFVLGNGLVIIGTRVAGLVSLVRQMNMVGLLMTDWVSRCVPYFAAGLICYEILWHETSLLKNLWLIMVLALVVSLICIAAAVIIVAQRKQVNARLLVSKVWPSFAMAVRSGGLDEGYGETEAACISDLGIEKHYVQVSLPHGMVLYMPINVIGTLILTIFAAAQFGVEISPGWLIIAWLLAIVMFVATPPVPGANLLAYIMIFDFLGVPDVVLIDAMIFEVLFGIFASAGNQTMLLMDLIMQSDKIGLLDRQLLNKDRRNKKR